MALSPPIPKSSRKSWNYSKTQMEETLPLELVPTTTIDFHDENYTCKGLDQPKLRSFQKRPSEMGDLQFLLPILRNHHSFPRLPKTRKHLNLPLLQKHSRLRNQLSSPLKSRGLPTFSSSPKYLINTASGWKPQAPRASVAIFSGVNLAGSDLTEMNLQGAQLNKTVLRGADLSMANLRGASFVEADLRDANLLGAEFSRKPDGRKSLWRAGPLGGLGGTNLFDATLPEAVAAHDGSKTIAQSTQSARRFYAIIIGLCVAACGLVALTTDVRLLLDRSAVTLHASQFPSPFRDFCWHYTLLTILYFRLQFLSCDCGEASAPCPGSFSRRSDA